MDVCVGALLENSAITRMVDLSARLIHRDWPVITVPCGSQMDAKWKYCVLCDLLCLSLSLYLSSSFSIFLTVFILCLPTVSSVHSTTLMHSAEPTDRTSNRTT
jgi:hypothetical protein